MPAFCLALLSSCGGRNAPPSRHAAPPARHAAAPAKPATVSDPFQPLGCERRFPSPGTRFIERYEFDRRRPPRPHATYFGGDERVTLRSVSVDAVDGAAISRARVLQDGYVSKDQTYIRVLVRGDDRLDPSELALVGETSFSLAIDKVESVDDTAPLARAIAAWMEEELGPNARVKLGDPAYTGIRTPYLQYPVSAKGHTELFATCHGLYSDLHSKVSSSCALPTVPSWSFHSRAPSGWSRIIAPASIRAGATRSRSESSISASRATASGNRWSASQASIVRISLELSKELADVEIDVATSLCLLATHPLLHIETAVVLLLELDAVRQRHDLPAVLRGFDSPKDRGDRRGRRWPRSDLDRRRLALDAARNRPVQTNSAHREPGEDSREHGSPADARPWSRSVGVRSQATAAIRARAAKETVGARIHAFRAQPFRAAKRQRQGCVSVRTRVAKEGIESTPALHEIG